MSANASAPRHISAPQPALERAPGATIGRAATDRDVTDAIRYAGSIRDGFAVDVGGADGRRITGSHVAAAIQFAHRVLYSRPIQGTVRQ